MSGPRLGRYQNFFILLFVVASLVLTIAISHKIKIYQSVPKPNEMRTLYSLFYRDSDWRDGVVFLPDWFVGYATDLSLFNGYSIYSLDDVLERRIDAPDALWTIRLVDIPDLRDKLAGVGYRLENYFVSSGVICERYVMNGSNVRYDFVKQLGKANAYLRHATYEEVGRYSQGAISFESSNVWSTNIRAAAPRIDFGSKQQLGIWFHPMHGITKVLEYDNLPKSNKLTVMASLTDSARLYGDFTSIYFSTFIDDELAQRVRVDERNRRHYFEVDLTNRDYKKIRFEVESPESDKRRHMIFSASLR